MEKNGCMGVERKELEEMNELKRVKNNEVTAINVSYFFGRPFDLKRQRK